MRLGSFALRAQGESRATHSRGVDFVQRGVSLCSRGDDLCQYVMVGNCVSQLQRHRNQPQYLSFFALELLPVIGLSQGEHPVAEGREHI